MQPLRTRLRLARARDDADGLRRDAEEDCRRTQEKLRNVGAAFGCSVDDMAKRIEREVGLVIGNVCGMLRSAVNGADEEISELSHRLGTECENLLDSALRSAKHDVANATGIPAEELHAIRRGDSREDRVRGDRREDRVRDAARNDLQRSMPSREDRARAEVRREEQRRTVQRQEPGFRSVFSQREKK